MKNNICTHQNCDLKLHKNLDKCVLHCHKNDYHTDRNSDLLSEFYKIDSKQIKNKTNLSPVLTSYIWGETNAIERYEVTAKTKGVSHQVWQEVKKSSKRFDSINHIIEATKPKVVFILYKYVNKNYLFDINDSISFGDKAEKNEKAVFKYPKPDPECKYDYYFLREQQTHVFVLPHPRWIGMNGGHKMYAQSIIKFMENNKIWPQLPTKSEDWEIKNQNTDYQIFIYF